jgi:formylmethanofuran dehydrogenase subunit E
MKKQVLTIREANRLARGRAKVSTDPEDARLWRVERPGSVQVHEPMTREAWLAFLETGVAAPTKDGQTAAEVYAERRRDIDRLLEWLGQELAKHAKEAKAEPKDWSASGDLYRIRSCLIEALAGLRGVEVESIEDHLDDEVAEGSECPRCGERSPDHLVWQDDGTVRCSTCGQRYTPPVK